MNPAANLIKHGDDVARQRAAKSMMGFLDALAVAFPECELCAKAVKKFRSTCLGIDLMEDMACAQWLGALATPLPASVAPYVYPLARLTAKPPVLYHAVAYKDGDTLVKFGDIPLVSTLQLDEKWHHPEFVDNRSVMLSYIEHITKAVLKYATVAELEGVAGPGAPPVPTRDEIEAEITRFAAEQRLALPGGTGGAVDASATVASGFDATLGSIVGMIDMHGGDEQASADMAEAELKTEWDLLMDNDEFVRLCNDRDDGALRLMETSAIPSFGRAIEAYTLMPANARADFWQQINNLTSFSILTAAMPPLMRTKVEEMSARLTGQLSNQTMSLDDLTPQAMLEIGQQILASTTEDDLATLQSQMSTLGPAVKAMTRNNEYMQGLDRQTGGMISRMM